ncbi:MAG: hypothetical protein ACFBSG_11830 [Leptolyngbyaceae cyanobacterium]
MFKQFWIVTAGAIAASTVLVKSVAAQSAPPVVTLGDTSYQVDFKFGVFEQNLVELRDQPWYDSRSADLAADATRQLYDCAEGSPFSQPACAVPFDAFDNVGAGFGGTSPWFVFNVETGVAATAVGFSDVTGGQNVLRQVNTSLSAAQPYAVVVTTPANSVPEPGTAIATLIFGIGLGSVYALRQA